MWLRRSKLVTFRQGPHSWAGKVRMVGSLFVVVVLAVVCCWSGMWSFDSRRRFVGGALLSVSACWAWSLACSSSWRCFSALARRFSSFSRLRWARMASVSGSSSVAHLDLEDMLRWPELAWGE